MLRLRMFRVRNTVLLVALIAVAGCNDARYSLSYNQTLARTKTVALLPLSVAVKSIHSGGVLEERPDLQETVQRSFLNALTAEIRDRGREVVLADRDQATALGRIADMALTKAVTSAIVDHHYERSSVRVIDYELADTLKGYAPPEADAVLCVEALGVVPTPGREMLKITAIVVAGLLGGGKAVSTNDAILHLMLVDLKTGEVAWFHQHQDKPDVRDDGRVRRFVRDASSFLLEPIE